MGDGEGVDVRVRLFVVCAVGVDVLEAVGLAVGVEGDGAPPGFAAMVGRSGVLVGDLTGIGVTTAWGGWVGKVVLAGNVRGAGVGVGSDAVLAGWLVIAGPCVRVAG